MPEHEQTFIKPVGDLIEALSKAGRLAGDLSIGNRQVTLNLEYLGLVVTVCENSYKHIQSIGWLDLSEARSPFGIIKSKIDYCIHAINREIMKSAADVKHRPISERRWQYD